MAYQECTLFDHTGTAVSPDHLKQQLSDILVMPPLAFIDNSMISLLCAAFLLSKLSLVCDTDPRSPRIML